MNIKKTLLKEKYLFPVSLYFSELRCFCKFCLAVCWYQPEIFTPPSMHATGRKEAGFNDTGEEF